MTMKRRDFIFKTTAVAANAMMIGSLKARASQNPDWEPDPYSDYRVVRVYQPEVSDFRFEESGIYWKRLDEEVLSQMFSRSLSVITGHSGTSEAWGLILTGRAIVDLWDKKIAIKVNFNNTGRDIHTTLNNSPAMMSVLAKSLISAGVKEENICFFDCSRPFPDIFKDELRKNNLSKLQLTGNQTPFNPSEKSILLSDNKGQLRDGRQVERFPVPRLLIESDYLLNLHLVKIHQTGVTGAMKNLFGIAERPGFYVHHQGPRPFEYGNHLPDISLDPEIRGRARLNIAEFIFGGHTPDTIDKFTNESFFPDGKPSSIIVSRSPFYHDTVLYSFIKAEYMTCSGVLKRFGEMGPDTWLLNSANKCQDWVYEKARFEKSCNSTFPEFDLSFRDLQYYTV